MGSLTRPQLFASVYDPCRTPVGRGLAATAAVGSSKLQNCQLTPLWPRGLGVRGLVQVVDTLLGIVMNVQPQVHINYT